MDIIRFINYVVQKVQYFSIMFAFLLCLHELSESSWFKSLKTIRESFPSEGVNF